MNLENILWRETVPGGCHWSGVLRRGSALRVLDVNGGGNLSALFFNFEEKRERFNMPDTLKAQHTAFLTTGNMCYSDMGRVLCSIVADEIGWHDTICGVSDAANIREKYGEKPYAQARNAMFRNARDGLLTELGKWGLNARDFGATVNFFSKAATNERGDLDFQENHSAAGSSVVLRFEMDTIVALCAAPHPLDSRLEYSISDFELTAFRAEAVKDDDICRTHCAQNERAFLNTQHYFAR